MRASILQWNLVWAAPRENILIADRLVSDIHADLIFLPEMWDTGFVIDADEVAFPENDSPGLKWMKEISLRKGCAVAGSLLIMEDGRYFNRHYFVSDGEVKAYYDKHHLFSFGGETKRITPGDRKVTVEWNGIRFRLCTCYDLRFPEWIRNGITDGKPEYDILLCAASWPSSRSHAWNILLQARAIENQCFVLGANRTGSDPYCGYQGESAAINSYGERISQVSSNEGVVDVEIDMEHLFSFRRKMPLLKDI